MADRPRCILLHPGFHKTGTSAIQHFLWVNRERLAPHAGLLMLRHLNEAARAVQHFSRHANPLALIDLAEALDRAVAAQLPPGDGRDLVVSCEALSGHLPGWPGVVDWRAVPPVAAVLAGLFAERVPGAEIRLVYTTRAPAAWLDSAWRHHLLGQRLRMDAETFAAAHASAADLDAVVAEAASAVAQSGAENGVESGSGGAETFVLPLEEAATHPQGPGGALLELIDLPEPVRASLVAVGADNAGPDAALAAALLAINRSNLSDGEARARRAALARSAGLTGWGAAPVAPPGAATAP